MRQIELHGNHYEIGYTQGKSYRKNIGEAPHFNNKQKKFAKRVQQKISPLFPEILQEIQGFAEGGNFSFEDILTFTLTVGNTPGCTVFAISGENTFDHKTIFARNYDGPEYVKDFELIKTYPIGYYSHIGCLTDLILGREDGINDKGLAVAYAGVHGKYNESPGVWDHIAIRAVLEKCANTYEAIKLLEKIPHLYSKNFIVADSSNQIAIIEASQQKIKVTQSQNGFGVITNHFISESMTQYNDDANKMYKTYERRKNVIRWFETTASPISITQIISILNDPDNGCLSNKVRVNDEQSFLTLWSWIACIGDHEILLSEGAPISGYYDTFFI